MPNRFIGNVPKAWESLIGQWPRVVIELATVCVFAASILGPFHLDDYSLFSDEAITSPSGAWRVWRPVQTRPLTYFTFWLNYHLGGENPAGYHIVNVGLHLVAVWLFYGALVRIADSKATLLATALFALHPIQVEPVAYVFERATILSTIFCLLSLRFWLDGRYWYAVACFASALLGKEECVTFPVFLLMTRRTLLPAAGMLCLSLVAGVRVLLALEITKISGAGARAGISALDYFSTQGSVILRYLRLMLIPYSFSFDPDIPIVRGWRAWLSWLVIVGAAAVLWKTCRYGKWFAAGLILLVPSSTIFPAADLSADRRMYLPMVAFALFAGLAVKRVDWRILTAAAAVVALFSTFRVHVWRSERLLWTEAVARAPLKLRPRIQLSRTFDAEIALRILDSAQTIAPIDSAVSIEKGFRLMMADSSELALTEFERARALDPTNPQAVMLAGLDRQDGDVEKFHQALVQNACSRNPPPNLRPLRIIYADLCK
jgi:protein O-mannosyl-transferase